MKGVAWNTESYGCKSQTLKKNLQKRMEAFEMYLLHTLQGVSWGDEEAPKRYCKWQVQKDGPSKNTFI